MAVVKAMVSFSTGPRLVGDNIWNSVLEASETGPGFVGILECLVHCDR